MRGITMKCVVCKEEMIYKDLENVDMEVCPSCGGSWIDGGELKEMTGFNIGAGRLLSCYKCQITMQTKMVKGVEVDICPMCSSIWLDGGELMELTGLDYEAGRIIICPKCDEHLQTKVHRGVEIDICPKCTGVYLDRGELERLIALETDKGMKTGISQFLHDAQNLRIKVAVRTFSEGRHDKGKAADLAGVSLEEFDKILEMHGSTDILEKHHSELPRT